MTGATFGGVPLMDATPQPDAGAVLIHGPQGSGKTRTAATIAGTGKTLFIDLVGEKGTKSFEGEPFAKNIDIIRPESVTQLDDIFWALEAGNHSYGAVVLDSLTALQKMALRYLMGHSETAVKEIKQGVAPADQRTWGESLNIMTDIATFWFGLADGDRDKPMHVIMTAQTKLVEDKETGEILRRHIDVQRGALSVTMATPDYVMYTDLEPDLTADASDGDVYKHIVRFGNNPEYKTKGRVPRRLWGKMPSVLGRKSPTDLSQLSRILGWGGQQAPQPKQAKKTKETAKKGN